MEMMKQNRRIFELAEELRVAAKDEQNKQPKVKLIENSRGSLSFPKINVMNPNEVRDLI